MKSVTKTVMDLNYDYNLIFDQCMQLNTRRNVPPSSKKGSCVHKNTVLIKYSGMLAVTNNNIYFSD